MSIATEVSRLKNAKSAIAAAIAGKGVTVPDGTMLDGMAALIESIEAGGGGAIIEEGTFTPEADKTSIEIFSERFKQTLKLPKYMIVRPILSTGVIKDMTEVFLFVVAVSYTHLTLPTKA